MLVLVIHKPSLMMHNSCHRDLSWSKCQSRDKITPPYGTGFHRLPYLLISNIMHNFAIAFRRQMKTFIDPHIDQLDWEAAMHLLPQFRREQVLRYRQDIDRCQSVAVWLLLRRACKELLDLDDVPAVAYDSNGKPYFPFLPEVHFNLSHCKNAVACAISPQPVGIDIETIQPLDMDIVTMTFSSEELRQVQQADCPELIFTKIWTMKESLIKLTGKSISNDLRSLLTTDSQCHFESIVDDGGKWVCTTCCFV